MDHHQKSWRSNRELRGQGLAESSAERFKGSSEVLKNYN